MYNLKHKSLAMTIAATFPHPSLREFEDNIAIGTKWVVEHQRAKRRGVDLLMGKDGQRYEMRRAEPRDISVIHQEDPLVSWNNGWLRHFKDNEWTGFMVRSADPAVRSRQLADRLAALKAKQLILSPPEGHPDQVLAELTTSDKYAEALAYTHPVRVNHE